jgi:hypothetical protein
VDARTALRQIVARALLDDALDIDGADTLRRELAPEMAQLVAEERRESRQVALPANNA